MTLLRTCLTFALAIPIVSGCVATAGTLPAAGPAHRHRVLMISIDGLRPDAVLKADAHGLKIPALRSFLLEGSYARKVINVNPTVTNPNHVTLVTGVLPREHGIYDNRPFSASAKQPKLYSLYTQIQAPTLWSAAKNAGLTTGSLFWPVTEGAKDIDDNVSGGSEENDQQIANDAVALIARKGPDFLTVHIVSLDHEEHKSGPFSAEANAVLERIDVAVQRIVAAERQRYPDSVVAIVSDHGFANVAHQINLNVALAQQGFITLGEGPDTTVASWRAFAWYVGGTAMMVLQNPQDRPTERRLKTLLHQFARNPDNGIERIYTRKQISSLGFAPDVDLVVSFKTGYRMGTALTGPLRTSASGGGHGAFSTRTINPDMHSAFFMSGPGIVAGRNLGTIDMRQIAPTIAGILQVPLPSATMRALPISDQ